MLVRIKAMRRDQTMMNVVICITLWDMLVDRNVGKCTFQELKKYFSGWSGLYDAHWAFHDNTRKSVEEMLGLIIGKETTKLVLLKELVRPQMMVAGKLAFKKNHEEIE